MYNLRPMQVTNTYKTKAKWTVWSSTVNGIEIPRIGYYSDGRPYYRAIKKQRSKEYSAGVNLIIEGSVRLTGHTRGRSSVSFTLEDVADQVYHTTASGMVDFFDAVSRGRFETTEIDGEVWYTGKWTCAKQGTEVSLVPFYD